MKGAAIAVAILAALVALGALIVAVWFLAATYLNGCTEADHASVFCDQREFSDLP